METIKWLVKLLALILIGLAVTSCSPKIIKEVVTKDSLIYKEKIIYRDTTIYKYLPGDTVFETTVVYVDKNTGLVNSKKLYTSTSLAEASAWVYNSKLFLNLIQKDTTIEFRLDSVIKEATYWKERYQNNSTVVTKETFKSPWYMKVLAWIGSLSLVVIGLWIYRKFKV